jgi:copper(I)-binding protein
MHRLMMIMLLAAAPASTQDGDPKASEGWVMLPPEGETSARAFAVVRNPGMYDAYLVSASSEVAGKVELKNGDDAAKELTVPAYGKLTMSPEGAHLVLVDLERPLEEGESIPLKLVTDSNVELLVDAVVRTE